MPDYSMLPAHLAARGWPAGLESFAQQTLELGYKVSTDLHLRHTAWKGLLAFGPRERALVMERGCGSVALSLARNFDQVDAVCPDAGLARVLRARFQHLGRGNITVHDNLPPSTAVYDAVAVFGLGADEITRELTGKIARALAAHGSLYLAFDVSRPSRLHDWAVPQSDRIANLLRRHFHRVQPFRYIGPLLQPSELRPVGGVRNAWRERIAGSLARRRAGAIGIVASGENAGPSLFETVLHAAGPALEIERYVFAHPFGFSLIALNRARGRRLIIRMPMEERAMARAQVNLDITAALRCRDLPFAIPASICHGEIHGQPFFAEEMLDGGAVDRIRIRNERVYQRVVRAGARAITAFQGESAHAVEFTPAVIDRLISPVLRAAEEALAGQTGSHLLPDIGTYIVTSLAGRELPLVPVHGDYTYDNVLVDRSHSRVTGVFDWDLAQREGLPLIDLFYFLIAVDRARTNRTFPPIFAEAFRTGFNALEEALIANYCRALGISEDLRKALLFFCWLHHVGVREYRAERYLYLKSYWTETMEAASAIAAGEPETILA